MLVKYTGKKPKTYRDVGDVKPENTYDISDGVFKCLLAQGEPFEKVSESPKAKDKKKTTAPAEKAGATTPNEEKAKEG